MNMNKLSKTILVTFLMTPLIAQARLCIVNDFDTRGCQRGDDLLFMPRSFGNEQFPIEFAGKKCDQSKQITFNKGGVFCTYAGVKKVIDGTEEITRKLYGKKYRQVVANPTGWKKMENGSFWRVVQSNDEFSVQNQMPGNVIIGDRIDIYAATCLHDEQGNETSVSDYSFDATINEIRPSHYLWQAGSLKNGSKIEIVSPTSHRFLLIFRKYR